MDSLKTTIETALSPLQGLPLWSVGRAGSLAWLQFGARHMVADRRTGTKEVGDYALHVDCPWSWTTAWGDEIADHESTHSELTELDAVPAMCKAIEADAGGGLLLRFEDGSTLTIAPEAEPDVEEYWRFFEPHRETPHFVIGPNGVET